MVGAMRNDQTLSTYIDANTNIPILSVKNDPEVVGLIYCLFCEKEGKDDWHKSLVSISNIKLIWLLLDNVFYTYKLSESETESEMFQTNCSSDRFPMPDYEKC
jgi:hypothetical protein